ncbi:MAG: hypothetical protein K6G56_00925 [Clostridiales bacterium]|nr:hypothetical protein [Clostridiales bacterium]
MKKKTLIILIILLALIAIGMILFILLNRPETALRRKLGVKLPDTAKIENDALYWDTDSFRHAYEIDFGPMSFDEIMDDYLFKCANKQNNSAEYYNNSIADGGGIPPIPYQKSWLDVSEETILYWGYSSRSTRIVVTEDTEGNHHVYIEWFDDWYGFLMK